MAITDYFWSQSLDARLDDVPFYALVMLCMRRADSNNLAALTAAFPGLARELQERYNAPAGMLESDRFTLPLVVEISASVRRQIRAIFQEQS